MTPRLPGAITLAVLTFLSAHAVAQTSYPHYAYGGISAGQSKFKINAQDEIDRISGVPTAITDFDDDDKDTAWKAFLGYKFSRYVGIEGGYFDLGKSKYSGDIGTPFAAELKYRGWNLDLIGTIPFTDRFALLARVGATRSKVTGDFDPVLPADQRSRTQNNYKYGLGLQYEITPSVLIRADWERYRLPALVDGRHSANVASLSLVFPFGRKTTPAPTKVIENTYVVPVPAPAPVEPPPPAPAPVPEPAPTPMPERVTFSAESLFGFDQDKIGANGRQALDQFAETVRGTQVEHIHVIGHTDRLGSAAYNQKLSERRAAAVKGYLVNVKGVPSSKITARGAGESQPVTKAEDCPRGDKRTPALVSCLQPDRRVEIEIKGVRNP